MLVSMPLEPLLEKELEQAARRLGVTPAQFIVLAVQRVLEHENLSECVEQLSPTKLAFRSKLMAQRAANQDDWLAYQAAKEQGQKWSDSGTHQAIGDPIDGMYDLVRTNKRAAP